MIGGVLFLLFSDTCILLAALFWLTSNTFVHSPVSFTLWTKVLANDVTAYM